MQLNFAEEDIVSLGRVHVFLHPVRDEDQIVSRVVVVQNPAQTQDLRFDGVKSELNWTVRAD